LIPVQYSLESPTAPEISSSFEPHLSNPPSPIPPPPSTSTHTYSPQPPPTAPVASTSQLQQPTPRQRNGPLLTPKRDLPVPDQIPGVLVEDTERHWQLRYHLAELCGIRGTARSVSNYLFVLPRYYMGIGDKRRL